MKVYLLIQSWSTPYDGQDTSIIGVYDSLEKAQKKLAELYQEDCDWMRECEGCEKANFEQYINDTKSYVEFELNGDVWYSFNSIQEKEVL